jgi:copper(I)-binding protein
MIRARLCVLSSLLLAIPTLAIAQQNGIQVDHAWSRAAIAGHIGVVYLTITDTGAADRLTSVVSPVATEAALHESFNDNGISKMRPVAALPVQPGNPVTLAPGGYHIMLMGLKQPLKQGDSFPVTLTFEKAGAVTTTVTVEKAGASAPTGGMTMPMGKSP